MSQEDAGEFVPASEESSHSDSQAEGTEDDNAAEQKMFNTKLKGKKSRKEPVGKKEKRRTRHQKP